MKSRYNTQHSGVEGVAPLVDAIRAIPTGPRFNEGKALSMFVQAALCAVIDANSESLGRLVEAMGRTSPWSKMVATRVDHQAFGFSPFARIEAQPFGWETAVVKAYMQAVKSNAPFEDVLSAVHADFLGRFGGNGLGQHFTPCDLVALIGAISADHFKRHPKSLPEQGVIRLGEPSCGAGALVLGSIRQLIETNGVDIANRLAIHCNDLDPLCSAMTALQIMANQFIHCIPLAQVEVTVGNTLTMNLRMGFQSISLRHLESQEGQMDPLSRCFLPSKPKARNIFGGVHAHT